MPTNTIAYIRSIFYAPSKITCTMVAAVNGTGSHDRFTRLLTRIKWEGQTLLSCLILRCFGNLNGGYLIIDDTVITKQFAKVIECVFWVWSSKEERTVRGINLVVICWSNGIITIPIAFRVWRKGGKSKCDLALDLLSYGKRILKLSPTYVLFDGYYASRKMFRRLQAYHWKYVTTLKKNRIFHGKQVCRYQRNPYWRARGTVLRDCPVTIMRHGKKYFATNDHTLASEEIRELYRMRWAIEEVFKFLHSKLGLDDCQSRSGMAQSRHITLCFSALILLERERLARQWTRYRLKRVLSLRREQYQFIAIKPIFEGA